MRRFWQRAILCLVCMILLSPEALAADMLIPVGEVIGIQLSDGTVTVEQIDEAVGEAAKRAGLQPGDQLLSIDSHPITGTADVAYALQRARGQVQLRILREGKEKTLTLMPQITGDGPKLGVYLKQGITGVGTVTWYDPETGDFGALGHGVTKSDGGLLAMDTGTAYRATVSAVKKGQAGQPGQLTGQLTDGMPAGSLTKNTPQGLFGTTQTGWKAEPMPVARAQQGAATVRSTVSGSRMQEYSVEILKIYPNADPSGRNMLLKVTDPALLEATGGIVQGMSGSPIIQDGKLVGAVTHVLVNDPTTGYGIFIENMLDAAA